MLRKRHGKSKEKERGAIIVFSIINSFIYVHKIIYILLLSSSINIHNHTYSNISNKQ